MKKFPLFDILFIIIAAAVLLLVNHFASPEILLRYSFLLVFIAYAIGKYLGKAEMRKNLNEDKSK
jgi:hypothetical protein